MKQIYTSPEQYQHGQIIAMLEEAGIEYVVRNAFLSGALGELPPHECWPQIWITHDQDYEKAMAIVDQASAEITDLGKWHCECGEENEGTFGSCWKCGGERQVRSEE